MTRYLTDGTHLYEIAARRTVQNSGCFERSGGRYGATISYTIIRDCVTEATASIDDFTLTALTRVGRGSP